MVYCNVGLNNRRDRIPVWRNGGYQANTIYQADIVDEYPR